MPARLKSLAAVALAAAVSSTLAAEPTLTRGRIESVTVYRGQALVTRVVELPKDGGLQDVVVTDLPAAIVPGSVYAEVEGGAEVRHVRPRTRALLDDVRDDVRKFDEGLAALAADAAKERARVDVLARHGQYLDKLEGFAAPTANVELTRGVLNADTLQKLTAFVLAERERVASETLAANARLAELAKQTDLLNRQKAEVTGRAERTAREAVLMVDVRAAGAKVRLRYLVSGATWSPSYTVHATSGKADVAVHYQAILSQVSGEDWTDVAMTLSTATPSVVARAPDLAALRLTLAAAGQPDAGPKGEAYAKELSRNRADAARQYMGNSNAHEQDGQKVAFGDGRVDFQQNAFAGVQRDNIYTLRRAADQLQQAELVLDKASTVSARGEPTESVTVTYVLPTATSLPSRADQQLVGIASATMRGEFYKLAVPVLTDFVYNEAYVTNANSQLLLAGPTMSYLDGAFVGAGELPTVAAGEAFTAGFGVDATLRASRELVDKAESISGGNKVTTLGYAIRVENFGANAASVRIVDRVPLAAGKDLKVALASGGSRPVDDAEAFKRKGQLRWDVEVPANATAARAVGITYGLTVEHDRNLSLVGVTETAGR